MSFNEEQTAQRIDAALAGDESKVLPEDKPYLRMAKALKLHAAWKQDKMDPKVAAAQKEHLLEAAKKVQHSDRNVVRGTGYDVRAKKPWFLWVGGAVAVAVVVLFVFASQTGTIPFKQLFNTKTQNGPSKLSLIIPAANAGDAFSMLVAKQNDGKAELDTSFQINSKVNVDQDTLKQSLKVVKVSQIGEESVPFDFNKTGDNQFDVKPQGDLENGSVYRVVIATAVKDDAGELRQRDFSWAVQTKDTFRVLRAVPGNASTGVPLDTAIELTLSQTGWQDPAQYFSMEPQVKGRFETHGRVLAFLPDKPLSPSTLYTVTFKKDWGLGEGESSLAEDYVVRFQTGRGETRIPQRFLNVTSYLFESAPGTEPVIGIWYSESTVPINVTGYALSYDDAKSVVQQIESQPAWIDSTDIRNKALEKSAKSQSFTMQGGLEDVGNYSKGIRLSSGIQSGFYAVKLEQEGSQPTWVLLQMTNLAAYSMADKDQILVWTVNTETGKPVETSVALNGQTVKTDAQGVAHLKAPDGWAAEKINNSQDRPSAILELGEGSMRLLSVLRRDWVYSFYGSSGTDNGASYETWSYLYTDRPLYRSQDKINIFGLLQDRNSKRGTGTAEIRLMNRNFLDFGTFESKVYAKANYTTDAAGFFDVELSWNGALTPGYYDLVLYKDGERVTSRSVEIRDTAKPAYYLQVLPEEKNIFVGEKAKGQVIAKFFDGTPVSKAKISLNASGGFNSDNQPLTVTTDDAGFATYSFDLGTPKCDLQQRYMNCYAQTNLSIEARPVVGEEGEIYAYANYNVWRSHSSLNEDSVKGNKGNAVLRYRVRKVDPSKANGRDDDSVLTDGQPGVVVHAKFIEQHWDKVQTGNYFDPLEKKVVPQYRYDQRDVEAGIFDATTDVNGYATFSYQMKDGISYRVLVWMESSGVTQSVTSYISSGIYVNAGSDVPSLAPTNSTDNRNAYHLGEKVSLSFTQSGQKMTGENSSFLFVHAARGIRSTQVSSDATHEFDFIEEDVPNMTVYGVVFSKKGFAMSQYTVSFDTSDRELNVVIEPDKASYAPGGAVTIRVKVTDKDGHAVNDAHVAVSVSDEALLAIAQLNGNEMPLDILYHWLPDGIVATGATHAADKTLGYGAGGAEMGGGERSASVRKNFKDQASFMVFTTNDEGVATGSFVLPDNITSWRLTAVAMTQDLRAGAAKLNVSASKPLFVEAVVPQNILSSDKPVLKLRAFGAALPKSGEVTYTVDAPSLGIIKQEVKGQVNQAVYLALENSVVGTHKTVVSVSINGQTKDAIERTVSIDDSGATHNERVSVELAPGTELPDVGKATEVRLAFESKTRSMARGQVEGMANPWSARLESAVAGRISRGLLRDYYQFNELDSNDIQLTRYQLSSGGLAVLPYSSEDIALSSKVAAIAPDGIDQAALANYFWGVTDDAKSSREGSIQALAGLAALGQPVISRLHQVAELADLSWRETLALARGLDAIGERETARTLLDGLILKSEEHDGSMALNVSKSQSETIEATAEAAALAAAMAHPSADKLMAYVESNWNSDVLTDLDRAMFLQKVVPTLVQGNVKIAYAIGQDQKTIELNDNEPVHYETLTADEARAFRVISVDGPAAVSYDKRVEGDVSAKSNLLNVNREYEMEEGTNSNFHEGDLVRINLTATWNQKAQDGCYVLRDRLPAGFMPVVNISFDRYAKMPFYFPFDVQNNEVSFVVCKQDKPLTFKYLARIVSLGTYNAPGVLLQSMETPSLATVSAPSVIEVK